MSEIRSTEGEGRESLPPELIHSLHVRARNVRRNILLMAKGKGQGYVGQGLGAADILTALYCHEMRFDPQLLDWPDRDRFLLSTGHYSIALFAVLAELGVIPREELSSYGADESRLEMSACETTPGVEITGGSLGHGLSQAVGMAIGSRLSGRRSVRCRISGGIGSGMTVGRRFWWSGSWLGVAGGRSSVTVAGPAAGRRGEKGGA